MSKKKVLVVGNYGSIHFHRWCGFLRDAGLDVYVRNHHPRRPEHFSLNYSGYRFHDVSYRNVSAVAEKALRIVFWLLDYIFLRWSRFDYVNLHYANIMNVRLSMVCHSDIVLTCWGSDILVQYRGLGPRAKARFDSLFKRSKAITVCSLSMRNTILERCPSIAEEKLHLVFWGVDEDLFVPASRADRENSRNSLGIPSTALVFLSMRTMQERYRILEIIRWFKSLSPTEETYLLVHTREENAYLDKCRVNAADDPRIIFHIEKSPDSGIVSLCHASDFSLSFPVSDATPVSMLEAFACNLPVIAGDGIESYHELAAHYPMLIRNLDELTWPDIESFKARLAGETESLREKCIRLHSRTKTIESLRKIFQP